MLKVRCSSLLSLGVTKPLFPLPLVTNNITHYISRLETSQTLLGMHTKLVYCQWPFSQSQKVSSFFFVQSFELAHGVLCSIQETSSPPWICQICLPTLPCMPCMHLRTSLSQHDNSRVGPWPWWSPLPHVLQLRSLYCRLSRAGVSGRNRSELVSKVHCFQLLFVHN